MGAVAPYLFERTMNAQIRQQIFMCRALSSAVMALLVGLLLSAQAASPMAERPLRDADRIIEKLRDTTLLPLLSELRARDVTFVEEGDPVAHWFFGLDTVFWVDGRHDAVSWNTGSLSRSTEQAVGVNQGAFAAMRQGKLYTLGGTGIYKEHANLFVFNVLSGWALMKIKGAGPSSVRASRVVEVSDQVWWVLGASAGQVDGADKAFSAGTVWELDLVNLSWRAVGALPERQLRDLGDFAVYQAGGYAAIFGDATGGVLELVTGDWVEVPGMTRSEIPRHDAHGMTGSVLHWLMKSPSGSWSPSSLDLAERFDRNAAVPFLAGPEVSVTGKAWMVWGAVGLGVVGLLLGAAFFFSRRRGALEAAAVIEVPVLEAKDEQREQEDDSDWELVQSLLMQPQRLMNAMQMNEVLGIGPEVSEDSQRSRRARAIRRMNAAFELRHGRPFITRERDPLDRRHLLYKVDGDSEA